MNESTIRVSEFIVHNFCTIVEAVPFESWAKRPGSEEQPGNSVLWNLGHLALCVDFCSNLLGDELAHSRWVPVFGPGSSGEIRKPERYSGEEFFSYIKSGYQRVLLRAGQADPGRLLEPHSVELFADSSLKTRNDAILHLSTTHIAYHCAQVARCKAAFA